MSRPSKCRRVFFNPKVRVFYPENYEGEEEEIILTMDELEAIRLADKEGLYREDAANIMGISRQTFGNILNSAHRKIANAIIEGRVLRIEGGSVRLVNRDFSMRNRRKRYRFRGGESMYGRRMGSTGYCICSKCGYRKEHTPGTPCRDEKCPTCKIPLVREGSYHHQLIQKKKGGKDV